MHAQSCLTLCDPMDYSPPDSSVHGISQARILEWVATPPPEDLPDPEMEPVSPVSPALAGGAFTPVPRVQAMFRFHQESSHTHIV